MAEGTVTLSLDSYESMQDEIRELRLIKDNLTTELAYEKSKMWKVFGPYFEPKRKVETVLENGLFDKRHFVLTYDNPRTVINFNDEPFVPYDDETKGIIIKTLIERHIADVIKNIDFSGLEQWLQEKKISK